jgi:hypothetical protein
MSRTTTCMAVFGVLLAVTIPLRAAAQCQSVDFENLAVGTIVTSQYDGVTFSVVGQSCSGSPTIYLRIANQFLGDSFGSKVLLIDQGCPDFSSDYLRMVFDLPQHEVSFTLGPWYGPYQIRAYSTVSGGSPISTANVTLPGSGFVGCHRLVRVVSASDNIRRIEIQETNGMFEAIDDLAFGVDDTPPTAEITAPTEMACVCGSVLVQGVACDEDGAYGSDRLEYLRVYPAGGSDWTLIGEYFSSPVCEPGALYSWNTSAADVTEGLYVLRLTVTNACGLSSSAVTTVSVDKDFDNVTIRSPSSGAILGGTVCLDGTVWDEFCFDSYTVEYQPAGGGVWQPVDPVHPSYSSRVINDPFASWVTPGVVADGNYNVRVVGQTDCGNSTTQTVALTIDNTPPQADILQPEACSQVEGLVPIYGTASDAHIYQWRLDYYWPATGTWQNIAIGSSSVVNAWLANWDTANVPACYYAVRLRVWGNSIVNPCGSADREYDEDYLCVAVGEVCCPGDVNGDGYINGYDIDPFVLLLTSGAECP